MAAPAAPATIRVDMTGFRNADGQVLLSLFRGSAGFPGEPGRAVQRAIARLDGQAAHHEFVVAPGDYALAIVHDENANGELDTSWIGIPREGVGASNNAKGRVGPPKYRDARFTVRAGYIHTQAIRVMYL